MQTLLKYLSAGALSIVSLGAIANAPVSAASLTGATIGGSASSDYYVYDFSGSNTVKIDSNESNVQKVLDGNAASPTGNVELRASTEKPEFDATAFTKNTTLSGAIGGKSITLSSLTASDWATANYNGSGKTFGEYWFHDAFTTNVSKLSDPLKTNLLSQEAILFDSFKLFKGYQRFSDPNISYVNQNDQTGLISIGLAGHYDAASLLGLPSGANIQASEVVKYSYDGGSQTGYLYSFNATRSNLVEKVDGVSHSGNYEVTLRPVPVPAAFVGIAIAGAIGAAKLKRSKVTIKA